ncbi:Zn-ribbon domain-containing OB-fold protein [Sphingomonas sp. SUN039]|uniref:Zn-ribbon domain-containing OB-fold protein n=1 Tax=Sphingomonas sp. SUN039 TaxID=2937787 RepID=UPI00216442A3|nr:OB-fold domain-containing protein [Sphingomonas sp. SUN039]UVO53619.1 OB-fold domain-containing protein [Sphingomonas sp. SUN039]
MTAENVGPLVAGELDAPFWDAWKADESFLLHRCSTCGRHDWPASCCIDHGQAPMVWVPTSGAGTIDTYTIFYRAYVKELAGDVPYVVAVVRLDEGPYFHTRITGIAPDAVKTGMRVRVRKGEGDAFPLFQPE